REKVARHLADIEISLVEPRALDRRDDAADRLPHVPRVLAVDGVPRTDEDRVWAAAQRLRAAHRRVDAELPRLVVRGRDDAAPVRVTADDQRLGPQLWILEFLDGGEERVQVEVREDQLRTHSSLRKIGAAFPSRSIPSSSTSEPPIMKSV